MSAPDLRASRLEDSPCAHGGVHRCHKWRWWPNGSRGSGGQLTAGAAWQAAGQGDREETAHGGDRVRVMTLGSARDALGAAGRQIAQALGLGSGLEGEKGSARERG